MELMQYLAVLRKWYRLIVLVTLLAALAAALVSFSAPPVYEAEAQVAIIKSGAQLNFDPKFRTVSDFDTNIDIVARRKSLTTIAKNPDIAAAVIAKLGDGLNASEQNPSDLVSSIDVTLDGDLLKIKARANNPQKATLVANSWAQAYETKVNALYGEPALSPAELQVQADVARREYDEKERALVSFVATNSIEWLARQIAQKQQRLSDLSTLENKIERLLADATALKSKLSAGAASGGLGDELASVLLEMSAFSASSNLPFNANTQGSASQPINLQLRIDQLNSSASATEQLRNLDALIAALEDRRKAVRAEASTPLQGEVSQLQAQLEQQTARRQDLTRARDLASSTLITLMTKVAEANIAEQSKASVVRVALPAIAAQTAAASRKLLNVLLASVVGLALSVGIAFLFEYTHQTVSHAEQAAALLGLPVMGAIPEIHKRRTQSKISNNGTALLIAAAPLPAAGEALRLLKHNLLHIDQSWKVLLVASALPAEGKSTIAANLAGLMARAGKKVVLVDADFRQPIQHQMFGLKNKDGLSDILTDSASNWEAHCATTALDGLRLIPSGPLPADPGALLEAASFKRLMERLKASHDLVIVDAPAVLGLADCSLIAPATDCILMVVESERVSPQDALHAKEMLEATGVPIIGVVLNRTAEISHSRAHAYDANASPDEHRVSQEPAQHAQSGYPTANGRWADMRARLVELVLPRRGL